MSDIIQLLPDRVANQISAGEVIQRPASAVKELLENAIDAGSSKIELIIKDAGKTLIQVVDNGCGMTDTDARMSFERHATSKIQSAEELFQIKTKGFRGEALASIAAIAQVELKTRKHENDLGSQINIEGSEIKSQEPVSCSKGTSFSVKNLFFNVPARRNFLKSNAVETRHIIDEFERVAMAHEDIHFVLHNNGNEVFNLPAGSRRARLVGVLGKKYNDRLVPIEQETTIVNLTGYVVKPEFSKRTRGEQFFFVNNRFIKSTYLNHAVNKAFSELISKEQFPSYFLFLDVDPESIDINIHPTKTEIKFEDERSIYAIINSAVRNSLGKYNIAPSLDFEQETSFQMTPLEPTAPISEPSIKVDPSFNPFNSEPTKTTSSGSYSAPARPNSMQIAANIDMLQQDFDTEDDLEEEDVQTDIFSDNESLEQNWTEEKTSTGGKLVQINGQYIISTLPSGIVMIDQRRAHERVLYEQYLKALEEKKSSSQKLLFPKQIELKKSDFALIEELLEQLENIGFDIEKFGSSTIALNGLPVGVDENDAYKIIDQIIENHKNFSSTSGDNTNSDLALTLARSSAIRSGRSLDQTEMQHLVDQLFACEMPHSTPKGKPIVIKLGKEDLDQKFEK